MRIQKIACVLVAVLAVVPPAWAGRFETGVGVGFVGGAVIGAYAAPYHQGYSRGHYGSYTPSYYSAAPRAHYPVSYVSPAYPVVSPCWSRRVPVYDRFGDIVAVRHEQNCR